LGIRAHRGDGILFFDPASQRRLEGGLGSGAFDLEWSAW
jgi:hypothetical protein